MPHPPPTRSRQRRTGINDLPADVLLTILLDVFKDVYAPYSEDNVFQGEIQIHLETWLRWKYERTSDQQAVEYPAPECLASVCAYWRAAMSTATIFWRSFVIWVGRNPTPLLRVRQYLAWSRDHPLNILVLRRYDPSLHDPAEGARVRAIFALLLPHIGRWQSLTVKCLYARSLPRPRVDLVGRAGRLKRLILDSLLDDLPPGLPPATESLDAPLLDYLSMSGAHFRASYIAPLAQRPMPPSLRMLCLTDYSASQPAFPLIELLRSLVTCPKLSKLILAHLHLELTPDAAPLRGAIAREWHASIIFADMPGAALAEYVRLLDRPYVESMKIVRCTPAPPTVRAPLADSYYLTLEELPDAHTVLHYLSRDSGFFACKHLSLSRCAGLSPGVLRALARPRADGESETEAETWMCPNVTSLQIVDMPLIGSADVRAVLEARLARHEASGFAQDIDPGYVVSSVEELCVRGCGALALEDRQWFDENVATVQWDDWSGGNGLWLSDL